MPPSPGSAEATGRPAARRAPFAGAPLEAPLSVIGALLAGAPVPVITAAGWEHVAQAALSLHRVAPQIHAALAARKPAVPDPVRAAIAAEAERSLFTALAHKAETRRIVTALAPIAPVVLKGWPLAERLAGSAALRHARDIDLLIPEQAAARAVARLAPLGYVPAPEHRLRARALGHPGLMRESNEINLVNARCGIAVELHWRSHHFRFWPDLTELGPPVERHGPEGVAVPEDGAHLIYLALHGEAHLWLRLKWLADIHAMAARRGPALVGDLATAEGIGAGPALRLALDLSAQVFGTALPVGWPPPGLRERHAARHVLSLIGRGVAPGSQRARAEFYRFGLMRARGAAQALAVPRYLLWRRLRLGLTALGAGGRA